MASKKAPKKTTSPKKVDLRKLPKDERPAPSTGQSGAPLDLDIDELNTDETKVLVNLVAGKGNPVPVEDLAHGLGLSSDVTRAKLRARNSLRRLVRAGYAEALGHGYYRDAHAKAPKRTAKQPATAVAEPAGDVTPKMIYEAVERLAPNLNKDEHKTAAVVMAHASGMTQSKICDVLNLSRGYVIRRIRRVRSVEWSPTPEGLRSAIGAALGKGAA